MMLKVGITGGIGSGKSIVSEIFRSMGYPVFNSDDEAKKILYNSKAVHEKLLAVFGSEIFVNGNPDKKKLAELVFSDKEKLSQLNSIIHPMVKNAFESWLKEQSSPIIFKEAAILIESGSYKDCDKVIVVHAPEELRFRRVMKRDSVTMVVVKNRMKNQFPSEELKKYANHIIENDEDHALLPQINRILEELKKIC